MLNGDICQNDRTLTKSAALDKSQIAPGPCHACGATIFEHGRRVGTAAGERLSSTTNAARMLGRRYKAVAAVYDRRPLHMESFHLHIICTNIGAMNFH